MSGVTVRAAMPSDADGIAAVYAPVVTDTWASFEEVPPAPAELRRRMRTAPRLPWLVAADAGSVVGYAYASQHRARPAYRWSADCSVYICVDHRGRGLGRRLYEPLINALRDLGYVSAFAAIALPNQASVRLHEAMAFAQIGVFSEVGFKHGRWHDVGWWRRELRRPESEPGEPRPWTAPPVSR